MNDQRAMWNQKHAAGEHAHMAAAPGEFAVAVAPNITPGLRLLELGCGVGSDARYFADLGAKVIATDFSDVVIEQNKAKNKSANLVLEVMDIAQPFPYGAGAFDAVYAHLSLHYYDETATSAIFAGIARVLAPGGSLYFSCKSNHDPLYGDGTEIQPGVFEREGHLRHFFSREYTEQLLSDQYNVIKLEEVEGMYGGFKSAFIQCWAKKREL